MQFVFVCSISSLQFLYVIDYLLSDHYTLQSGHCCLFSIIDITIKIVIDIAILIVFLLHRQLGFKVFFKRKVHCRWQLQPDASSAFPN
ncbi:hypothetical protein SAMN05443667_1038 [Flavobacterium gillisiae]|uniref:Uncharacterized protein n=1 Tax=Flavobacterium gillisiae TaxID=150146 RepID=A0A1H3ZP73_9FLAO|nr:hypothetical protein SAMN05443667_1038 [Flavobacterium gillisiae]